MQVDFYFTDETIQSLSKTIAAFPQLQNEKDMPVIRLGYTVNHVSLYYLENFLRVCHGKVIADLEGTDLKRIIKRSKHAALLDNKDAKDLSKEDNAYLFSLQRYKLNQLLFFLLSENDENLKATMQGATDESTTLALIAFRESDAKLLELLLSLESPVFQE